MAAQYGIGVTRNRFELFDSDEDPIEVLKQHEIAKEERKKAKVSSGKENTTKDSLKTTQAKHPTGRISFSKDVNTKPTESNKAKDLTKRLPRPNLTKSEVNSNVKPDKTSSNFPPASKNFDGVQGESDPKYDVPILRDGNGRAGRTPGRGRGGGRGFRQGFDNRGKREFDRQSGSDKTGVKHVDKKDGAGAYNWDSDKELTKDILQARGQTEETWSPEKGETEPEPAPPADSGEEPTASHDETKEMTLDEWKALRVPRAKPVLNIRKAGEGEDPTRWKKMYALEKKHVDQEDDDEEYEQCEYPQRVGRQKHLLDIDIHFKDVRTPRGRGARGGRGTRAGVRGAQSPRPAGPRQVPKVDNEQEFPSLG